MSYKSCIKFILYMYKYCTMCVMFKAINIFGMQWAFFGSPDMLEYEVMKSPMGLREAALL